MYYFDNAASTKPTQSILDTYYQVSEHYFANPSSIHKFGDEAHSLLTKARSQIAEILAFNEQEIYFTSSGTESNNWVLTGVIQALRERHPQKNRLLISSIEHPSIMSQMDRLNQVGYTIDLIPVNEQGIINLEVFNQLIDDDVLLISTMAVNNEIGSIQPLDQIEIILKPYPNITWHVDGVQAVNCHLSLLKNKRIDLLTLSSHKFHSVRGAGILAKRQRIASYPLLMGGGQETNQRSGTENLAAIVAMSKALRLTSNQQSETLSRLNTFKKQIIEALSVNGWHIHSPEQSSPHIICASFPDIPGEVLVHVFAEKDMIISTTSACSSRRKSEHATLTAMGVDSSIANAAIRISMSALTSQAEVDYLCQQIPTISKQF